MWHAHPVMLGALVAVLLPITGAALRAWLRGRGLAWHEDASNRNAAIPRNFVRHRLLPELERTWMHDLRSRLCQSAETLREDDQPPFTDEAPELPPKPAPEWPHLAPAGKAPEVSPEDTDYRPHV